MLKRLFVMLVAMVLAVGSLSADSTPGLVMVQVTLDLAMVEEGSAVAKRLAAMYRGELRTPVDGQGSFQMTVSEAAAEMLRRDPQVTSFRVLTPSVAPPTRITTNAVTSWTLGGGDYVYDGSGNIRSIGTDAFTYDGRGRILSGGAGSGHSQVYTYDSFGNLRTITTDGDTNNKARLAASSVTNRMDLTGNDETGNAYNMRADYDERGNLYSHSMGDQFRYDALDVVQQAQVDGIWYSYLYSASDERIGTVKLTGQNGTEVRSNWTLRDSAGHVLRRYVRESGQWNWTEDYIYRGSIMLAAEVSGPEKVRHFHVDHLGTPRLVTGNGGVELSRHTYYPFGDEVGPNSAGEKQFTGHERDAATLDYMHARYFRPHMGRFLSVDPAMDLKKNIGEPQRWNRYSYVVGNPLRNIDPDGRDLILVFDFRDTGMTLSQQRAVMAGVRKRFVNAGVKNVSTYVVGATIPKEQKKTDQVTYVTVTGGSIGQDETGKEKQGKTGWYSDKGTVSILPAAGLKPREFMNYVINVASHEAGHASLRLKHHEWDQGTPKRGSIMSQMSPEKRGSELREFDEEDQKVLQRELNEQ